MQLSKAKVVSLKGHAALDETWLKKHLADDPTLLGLPGTLEHRESERRQPRAGVLDLLYMDQVINRRYEVEVQLGATDPSHIIRCLEYWDTERNRYPQYDHVAVLVAEDITSRFLNVISLFNKQIPIIAIQMRALEVGGTLTLHATTVLDLSLRGTDDEDEPGQPVDRGYWKGKSAEATVTLAEKVLDLINTITDDRLTLKWNRHYIGLTRADVVDNFITMKAQRGGLLLQVRLERSEEVDALVDESGVNSIGYYAPHGRYRILLANKADLDKHRDLVEELVRRASGRTADLAG